MFPTDKEMDQMIEQTLSIEQLDDVAREVLRAEAKHKPMNSAHEGYAVILEEFEELWDEVCKGGRVPRDPVAMRKEAVEVAAMAVRFIRDVCDGRNKPAPAAEQ
jgi:hypothetical protein